MFKIKDTNTFQTESEIIPQRGGIISKSRRSLSIPANEIAGVFNHENITYNNVRKHEIARRFLEHCKNNFLTNESCFCISIDLQNLQKLFNHLECKFDSYIQAHDSVQTFMNKDFCVEIAHSSTTEDIITFYCTMHFNTKDSFYYDLLTFL